MGLNLRKQTRNNLNAECQMLNAKVVPSNYEAPKALRKLLKSEILNTVLIFEIITSGLLAKPFLYTN